MSVTRIAWVLVCLVAAVDWGHAAPVRNLYWAAVPLAESGPEAEEEGIRAALAEVLVRITGNRDVVADPAVGEVLDDAGEYMQQYGYTGDGLFRAGFDGAAVEAAIAALGQPVWGADRPATLVWLALEGGAGGRELIGADEESGIRERLERVAAFRGVPLVLPLLDTEDLAVLAFADVWGGFGEKIEQASARYSVDALLVGRGTVGPEGGVWARWTLSVGAFRDEWRGSLDQAVHRIADTYAARFAVRGTTAGARTALEVDGVGSLRAYGEVLRYLETLTLVESVGVDRVAGETVVFGLSIRGTAGDLARALSLGTVLAPAAGVAPGESLLRYRVRP